MQNQKFGVKLVFYRTLFSQSAASLTMSSMAAFLRQNGFNCDLCLMDRQGLHNVEKVLQGNKKNIIFAKPNFKDYIFLLPLFAELKKRGMVNKIFFCGPYASINHASMMQQLPWLDGIIFGNAEETALNILQLAVSNKNITSNNCPGGVWRGSNKSGYFSFTPREYKLSLNDLPFPVRDIEKIEKGSYINIESSRGCSGGCSFCHVPIVASVSGCRGIDYRSPKLVVDEMELIYKTLGKKLFIFNDSCFWRGNIDNDRILEFCNEISKRKLLIKFYIYLRTRPEMPDQILMALRKAGLVRIFLGIENISDRSQKLFNKKIAIDAYEVLKKKMDAQDINIHIGYIVAEPYATLSEITDNIKYLRRISKLFRIGIILESVRVIPGSNFHIKLIDDNLIDPKANFDKITYGYKYKYRDTAKFVSGIKEIFSEIKDDAYEFEYYCTTAFLLKSLLRQFNKKKYSIIKSDFIIFESMVEMAMDDLLDFFLAYIYLIDNKKDNKVNINLLKNDFFILFQKNNISIKVKYADIVNKMNNIGAEEIVDCIYSGLDRVN